MALDKNGIAKRIAQELQNGWYVNLGIGIPTLVANYGVHSSHPANGLPSWWTLRTICTREGLTCLALQ
jgi:hypothetical protein